MTTQIIHNSKKKKHMKNWVSFHAEEIQSGIRVTGSHKWTLALLNSFDGDKIYCSQIKIW